MYIFKLFKTREWILVALALVTIVGQVFLELKVPDYMQSISTHIATPGSGVHDVLTDGGWMLACALSAMICAVVTGYCTAVIGTTLSRRMREGVFNKTMDFSFVEINKFSTDSLITRSTNDINQIQMFVVMGLQLLVKSPIMAIWASSKIASQNMTWTTATAIAVGVTIVVLAGIMGLVIPRMIKMQKITDQLNRVTREHLTGLRVIRAYNSQQLHEDRFESVNKELTGTYAFVNTSFAFLMPLLTVVMTGLSLAIYVLGAVMIQDSTDINNRVTLFGQMISFSSYALQVVSAFMMLAMVFVFAPRAIVSYKRVVEVLSTKISLQDGAASAPTDKAGTVEFRNVSFRYPGAEADALHSLSFTAHTGETVAIIGSTGSGKTSLVNLVPRFYDVREGEILVDGQDVREWNQAELRRRISFVPQKATLFSGTVASNIAFGDKAAQTAAEEIIAAAQISSSDEFVEAKDGAYAASVAQGGTNFSGGQRQRLAIARAVARQGEIMIFDDSFSALDYATDKKVRGALKKAAGDATQIIVAQRIGTVRTADKIIVLDKGAVVGIGTHRELMETNSVYQEIAYSQLSEEELA